jgi:hypothetical protein
MCSWLRWRPSFRGRSSIEVLIEPHYPKIIPQGGRGPFPLANDAAHLLPAAVV